MREFVTKSAILKKIWSKASQIALLETKIASPPPSFLVRETVPDCPPQRAIWDGRPSLPSTEGKLGRNRPSLPSRRAIWDDFGQRRTPWDAFGERPRGSSLTTHGVSQDIRFSFQTLFTSRKIYRYRIWNRNCPACCNPTNYGESSHSSLILVASYDMPWRKAELLFYTVKTLGPRQQKLLWTA